MTQYRDTPLPEAYSRVSNPERFRSLHAVAMKLLDRLSADYAVAETSAFSLLPHMQPFEFARPPRTLTPASPGSAPIGVAFTTFPGLVVRYGRWLADSFPACGCDACRETAKGEGERLATLLEDVVAGRFYEELTIPLLGQARLRWKFGTVSELAVRQSEGFHVLPYRQARALRGDGPGRVEWQPWPERAGQSAETPLSPG